MKHTRLTHIVCGIMLALVMTGCVAMPNGSTGPNYAGIELGSVIAMTVLVNEVRASQETKDATYARLGVLHTSLSCVSTPELTCPPYNLKVLPQMVANALPMEYRALGPAIISYIENKATLYYDLQFPESFENQEMVRKITVVVIGGAMQALAPHVSK